MNLRSLLEQKVESGGRVGVALIGAGKFGSMFLAQVPHINGLDVDAIVDLLPDNARRACNTVGWSAEQIDQCLITEDYQQACALPQVDVVIDATGNPTLGVSHALFAIEQGKHVVMVNVEADVLVGPMLAAKAKSAGVVYSMAYGDQPALVAEMVDWGRACGFTIAAAGKGTKYLPAYHEVTPDDVWSHYGLSADAAAAAGMNPQMFNSFLDGTKSAIEMAAIANACDLQVPADGLLFPPCEVDDLATVLCPESAGGVLADSGMVEVVSSMKRNGDPLSQDLRWGVYVVLEAPNDYAAACFAQYGLRTDSSGRYAAQYKPYHLIGLELSISVLSAALRHEPTGCSDRFNGDAVAVAKRDLQPGESLDGEGGYTVWGKLLPARTSVELNALPIGLAHSCQISRPVSRGQIVTLRDISALPDSPALQLRTAMTSALA
ncbi:MAG: Gfo/Idh/MocA family oxidoreductase [Pseudomonadota bacterium]